MAWHLLNLMIIPIFLEAHVISETEYNDVDNEVVNTFEVSYSALQNVAIVHGFCEGFHFHPPFSGADFASLTTV